MAEKSAFSVIIPSNRRGGKWRKTNLDHKKNQINFTYMLNKNIIFAV